MTIAAGEEGNSQKDPTFAQLGSFPAVLSFQKYLWKKSGTDLMLVADGTDVVMPV